MRCLLVVLSLVFAALNAAAAPPGHAGAPFHARDKTMLHPRSDKTDDKVVIAHRGASGYLPEHTLPAYAMAYALGADFIEPDLVMTRDGVLIALHDIHLETTTDVEHQYPDRARGDGRWYAADFSFEEIKTLNVTERRNADGSRVFPGRFSADAKGFSVPTFRAVVELVQSLNRETGCDVGIYPETKAPAFHDAENLPMEQTLLAVLVEYGYQGRHANVFVQSFSVDNLKEMRDVLGAELPMVQLIGGGPMYDAMATPEGLDEIARYAQGIGPDKNRIVDSQGALVTLAHQRGLVVHPYTFRADQLPPRTRSLKQELFRYYYRYDVDGVFTDFPDIAVDVAHRGHKPHGRFCGGR